MQKFIKIESKGLIDPQAFALLGASTKRDDQSKIGFFGSGLKYSIAYLLRNNIKFKVFSEYKIINFTTKKTDFRDKSFSIIVVDGKETSMTTDMGIDWESWFIIREIFCNAVDEGDAKISILSQKVSDLDVCVPVEDKTVFYIEVTPEFKNVIDNWNLYFSENRPDLISYSDNMQFYSGGEELIVYRKGVRCSHEKKTTCIFNYDLDWVDINESRVIKSDFDFKWRLGKELKKLQDEKVITKILKDIVGSWETQLFWDSNFSEYSNVWLSCIDKRILVPQENSGFWADEINLSPSNYLILPLKMVNGLKHRFGNDIRIIGENGAGTDAGMKIINQLSPKQNALLKDSIEFLIAGNYLVEYEILIVRFAVPDKLGLAKDNKIYLSEKLFDRGKKEVVATIIEENEHLITGYCDESRAFQNHFIMKYISEMENRIQKYL